MKEEVNDESSNFASTLVEGDDRIPDPSQSTRRVGSVTSKSPTPSCPGKTTSQLFGPLSAIPSSTSELR